MSGAPAAVATLPPAASSPEAPANATSAAPDDVGSGDGVGAAPSFDAVLSQQAQTSGVPRHASGDKHDHGDTTSPGSKEKHLASYPETPAPGHGASDIEAAVPPIAAAATESIAELAPSRRPPPTPAQGGHPASTVEAANDRTGLPFSAVAEAPGAADVERPNEGPGDAHQATAEVPGAAATGLATGTGLTTTTGLALGTGTATGETVVAAVESKVPATPTQRGTHAADQDTHGNPSPNRVVQPVPVDGSAASTSVRSAARPAATAGLGSTLPSAVHQVRQAPLTGQLTGQATPLGSVKAPPGSSPTPTSADAVEHASLSLDVDGLSGSISRTLSDGNGTYTVVVAMHPSDLGQVRAVLSLDGNDLAVSITPQSQAGHAALTNAADALKNQLAAGGLTVNVTLRDPGSPSGDDGQHANEPSGAGPTPATSSTPPPLAVPVLAAGQIHLML